MLNVNMAELYHVSSVFDESMSAFIPMYEIVLCFVLNTNVLLISSSVYSLKQNNEDWYLSKYIIYKTKT